MKPTPLILALLALAAPAGAQQRKTAKKAAPRPKLVLPTPEATPKQPEGTPVQTPTGVVYFETEGLDASRQASIAATISKIVAFYTQKFGPRANVTLQVVKVADASNPPDDAPGILNLTDAQLGSSAIEDLLAVQIARVWWGGAVKPAASDDLWLTEGLARYAAFLYVESLGDAKRTEAALQDMTLEARAFTKEEKPLLAFSQLEKNSWLYNGGAAKAAIVLHNLRQTIVGDQAFFAGLSALSGRPTLSTEDFQKAVETAWGKGKIAGYIATWVNSTQLPDFKVSWTISRTERGYVAEGTISQPLHTMTIPVNIEALGDKGTALKTLQVQASSDETEFPPIVSAKPIKSVRIKTEGLLTKSDPAQDYAAFILRGTQKSAAGSYQEAQDEFLAALNVKEDSSLAIFRIGEAFLMETNYQAAAEKLFRATGAKSRVDKSPAWAVAWSWLDLGKIYDLTDQRDRAKAAYQNAIDAGGAAGAKEEAERYLKDPFKIDPDNAGAHNGFTMADGPTPSLSAPTETQKIENAAPEIQSQDQ